MATGDAFSSSCARASRSRQRSTAAAEGGWIFVAPGIYRETASATNGLNITRGVNLVGLSTPKKKVVLENSGGQRNGIVAVPAAHTDCMSCHASMAPPFELLPGIDASALPPQPVIYGLSISGITIKDFSNNGLFTRNVDGFKFIDVHSVGNKNYGIFPTLSKNGLIAHSSATGADDSGIWIETSEKVSAIHNRVEGNVNGFEVSNSDEILLADNEVLGAIRSGWPFCSCRTSSTCGPTPSASRCATTTSTTTTSPTRPGEARSSRRCRRGPGSSTWAWTIR